MPLGKKAKVTRGESTVIPQILMPLGKMELIAIPKAHMPPGKKDDRISAP